MLPSHKTPADYIEGILELEQQQQNGGRTSSASSSEDSCSVSETAAAAAAVVTDKPEGDCRRDSLSPSLLRQKIKELEFTEQR